jgi:hypothetical protein
VKVTEKDTYITELWLLLQNVKSGVSNANIGFNWEYIGIAVTDG